jgi:hypothetical protein
VQTGIGKKEAGYTKALATLATKRLVKAHGTG